MNNLYAVIDKHIKTNNIPFYKKGDIVYGTIKSISNNGVIVNLGNYVDGFVPKTELDDMTVNDLKVGDRIRLFIISGENEYGEYVLSQKRTTPALRWNLLEEAKSSGSPVVVTVTDVNAGGVIVNIDGVNGFVPISQLDPNKSYRVENTGTTMSKEQLAMEIIARLTDLIGSKLMVKVIDVDRKNSKVIFSEKAYLTSHDSAEKMETYNRLNVGDIVEAKVTAVTNYGIFLNYNGVDGLLHVSEISWDKVESVTDYAKVGDIIKVKILAKDDENKRLGFSIKQMHKDPWLDVVTKYKVGNIVKGKIISIEDYGLGLEISEGVTGILHRNEMNIPLSTNLADIYQVGDELEIAIITIAPNERKMGFSVKKIEQYRGKAITKRKSVKSKKKLPSSRKAYTKIDIASALEKAGLNIENK
ncbi:MAG: S1 RNA-binding domain-containing protein [Candidatus Dojkabacteria bacterium]|nr:S1 RNA-binding domain-containing protein [Candidatus Dojkabacteria bacterium]